MFRSFFNRYKNAWNNLRREIKPIIGFEIWFSLIFAVVLAPFTAWLVDNLLISNGQIAVSNEDILSFFMSLRGALFIVLSASFFIGLLGMDRVDGYFPGRC
jgi:hypothetical protein